MLMLPWRTGSLRVQQMKAAGFHVSSLQGEFEKLREWLLWVFAAASRNSFIRRLCICGKAVHPRLPHTAQCGAHVILVALPDPGPLYRLHYIPDAFHLSGMDPGNFDSRDRLAGFVPDLDSQRGGGGGNNFLPNTICQLQNIMLAMTLQLQKH